MWVRVGGGLTECAQVHWQTGQGDRERRGGDPGVGLGQRDPEGEAGGRVDKDRGETGREEEQASWATKESLLGEAVTEAAAALERPGEAEGGSRVRLVGGVTADGVVKGLVV